MPSSSARSCETSSTVPGNASSAPSSASRLSRSRWFVGSSSTRRFAPERERRPAQKLPLPDAHVEALCFEHGASAARGLQELEAERAGATREQRDLVGGLLSLVLQTLDLRHLRLRLLRLVLLGAEPF